MENKTSRRIKKASILSGLILAGSIVSANIGGALESACEIYQGYKADSGDGKNVYVFDSHTLLERGSIKDSLYFALTGDRDLTKTLEIGQRYCFEFKEPIVHLTRSRIVSIGPEETQKAADD